VRGPAQRRIARIRWTTTVVFAATTAMCLTVLVVAALRIDGSSRVQALDSALAQQASSLAEVVDVTTDGSLDLSRLDATQAARTTPVVGVVTAEAILYADPDQPALPPDAELNQLLNTQRVRPAVSTFLTAQLSGAVLHWASAPILAAVPAGVQVEGFVIVGGPVPGAAAHARLRLELVATAILLVLLAAGLGHVISGFAMRPAVRGLSDLERSLVEASHELRTPLTVLAVILDGSRLRSADPGAADEAVGRARRQVDRLTAVTSALLVRARASAGTVPTTFERLRLDQLVEGTVAEMVEVGADEVEVTGPPTVVEGSPELLSHAVRNLVENALRHGGPPVRVTTGEGTVEVDDGGSGIPAGRRRRVVRPGVGSGDGTGMGLSIVAWVAGVHGGRLVLDDGPSGGLRARLELGVPGRRRPHRPLMRRAQDSST